MKGLFFTHKEQIGSKRIPLKLEMGAMVSGNGGNSTVDKVFGNPNLATTFYQTVVDSENFLQNRKKYARQNEIMKEKSVDFINGLSIYEVRDLLRAKNTKQSNVIADFIDTEMANITAKQFDTRTEEGKEKSKEQYDIKNRLLEIIYAKYRKNGWNVSYEPSTIPGINHTLFFIIPNTDIQLSYHGNFEGIENIQDLPEGKWDKIAGATFHKLEEASAKSLNLKIKDTNWRKGINLGFKFTQRSVADLSEEEKQTLQTIEKIQEVYSRFLAIPKEKLKPEQEEFIMAIENRTLSNGGKLDVFIYEIGGL